MEEEVVEEELEEGEAGALEEEGEEKLASLALVVRALGQRSESFLEETTLKELEGTYAVDTAWSINYTNVFDKNNYSYTSLERISRDQVILCSITDYELGVFRKSLIGRHCLMVGCLGARSTVC